MKKAVLIPIIIGSVLLVGGGVLFAVGIANNINNSTYVTNEHDVAAFNNINIDISTANVTFKASEDSNYKVICKEREKEYHKVEVKENTLYVRAFDDRMWYEYLFKFDFGKMDITIYTPIDTFMKGDIKMSTGDITIPTGYKFDELKVNMSTGDMHINATVTNDIYLEASTGRINFEGSAKNATIKASTGHVKVENTIIENHLDIHTSTGDIDVKDSDASTITIETSTGDVNMTLLTGKTYDVSTSTGRIHKPDSLVGGGLCKVHTSTGDININIKNIR